MTFESFPAMHQSDLKDLTETSPAVKEDPSRRIFGTQVVHARKLGRWIRESSSGLTRSLAMVRTVPQPR